MINTPWHRLVVALAVLLAGGCSGGTGGTGASNGGGTTAVVSTGVMTKGSVIINGVRYDDTTATIVIDDSPKTAADLRDGMVVKVVGKVNADGVSGTAEKVEAQIESRGKPSSVNSAANPPTLVIYGQTVIVDDQTVYSGVANFAAITTSTQIEVHGLRDVQDRIRATRIEAVTSQMGDSTMDEIRGIVSGLNGTSFNIGTQAINASGANVFPAGASYQNGSVVEVHCSGSCINGASEFVASRVEVEAAEDVAYQPNSGERFEVEGLISGFTAHPGNFSVAGTSVTTTNSTRFVGGLGGDALNPTDLANNIKVEAEGTWNGSTLTATKIEFKRSVVRLQGTVSGSGTGAFTLNVASHAVSIEADSFTTGDFAGGAVPPNGNTCVQVRGQRKAGGGVVVTAGEIRNSCSNSDRHVMQAPVEAKSPETTITLLGFAIDVSNPTDVGPPSHQWLDINENLITRTQFFNAVTPASPGPPAVAGTLVKVTFDNNNSARQAEIED